jgi:hypothetical protein
MLVVITEGNDNVFIEKYLEYLGYEKDIKFKTKSIGGWTNIKLSEPILRRYLDEGNTVVIIFDADTVSNNGGYEKRLNDIKSDLKEINLELDCFLFPNDKDDGDFEMLLERIASNDRKGVFNCFDAFENCVQSLENNELKFQTPNRKSRIFAYIETFPETKKRKDKELKNYTKFFSNISYWNLNSDALTPLHDFLVKGL